MLTSLRYLAALASLCVCLDATAQAFPTRQVRIIVGAAAGGPIDTAARVIGESLTTKWGQTVVVENRPGASEMIGAGAVAKSPADGYTLLMASSNPFTINPFVFTNLPYDPDKSFAAVSLVALNPMAIVASPKAPFSTLPQLIAYARAHPGELSWSTPGLATMNQVAGEWFAAGAGIKAVHVPYKGGPAAANAILAGDVPYGVLSLVQVIPFAKAGTLKVLGVTTARRTPLAPDWPTVAEQGLPEFDASVMAVLSAPAGTPPDVVNKINRDVNEALRKPDVRERFSIVGAEAMGSTSQDMSTVIGGIRTKVGKIVADANIKAD